MKFRIVAFFLVSLSIFQVGSVSAEAKPVTWTWTTTPNQVLSEGYTTVIIRASNLSITNQTQICWKIDGIAAPNGSYTGAVNSDQYTQVYDPSLRITSGCAMSDKSIANPWLSLQLGSAMQEIMDGAHSISVTLQTGSQAAIVSPAIQVRVFQQTPSCSFTGVENDGDLEAVKLVRLSCPNSSFYKRVASTIDGANVLTMATSDPLAYYLISSGGNYEGSLWVNVTWGVGNVTKDETY